VMVGTDPLRRAADAAETQAAIEAATGQRVVVVSHDEEAFLTLLGVTAGRPLRRNTILVDIGGGSSEVLWVPASGDPVAVGLPTGSARLTRRLVANDPPTALEIEALLAEARRLLAGAPDAAPDDVVVVGGTATNLLRLVPAAALDRRLTAARVTGALQLLERETASQAATRHGLKEPRARMMAAGAALVLAVIERYGIDRIRVDDNGIREGLTLAAVHAGDDWRQHLAWMAHGWSR
jgi:exopolyphosphatase/guanosine-5'-triphosphate,3'-diphosphate pyrophosphatase